MPVHRHPRIGDAVDLQRAGKRGLVPADRIHRVPGISRLHRGVEVVRVNRGVSIGIVFREHLVVAPRRASIIGRVVHEPRRDRFCQGLRLRTPANVVQSPSAAHACQVLELGIATGQPDRSFEALLRYCQRVRRGDDCSLRVQPNLTVSLAQVDDAVPFESGRLREQRVLVVQVLMA